MSGHLGAGSWSMLGNISVEFRFGLVVSSCWAYYVGQMFGKAGSMLAIWVAVLGRIVPDCGLLKGGPQSTDYPNDSFCTFRVLKRLE